MAAELTSKTTEAILCYFQDPAYYSEIRNHFLKHIIGHCQQASDLTISTLKQQYKNCTEIESSQTPTHHMHVCWFHKGFGQPQTPDHHINKTQSQFKKSELIDEMCIKITFKIKFIRNSQKALRLGLECNKETEFLHYNSIYIIMTLYSIFSYDTISYCHKRIRKRTQKCIQSLPKYQWILIKWRFYPA